MDRGLDQLQPAIKKETGKIAAGTVIGLILMWGVFLAGHLLWPEKIPMDYTVFLGGAAGGFIAVLNFFLMAVTVQRVAAEANEDNARARMKTSYSQRMLMQGVWIILAAVVPCFQPVAGIAPLLFPGFVIKLRGIFGRGSQPA